ncbi:ferredoxin [Microbacterium rhizomatis]|uniref:Ferredoxin n=1 Tax=Microbacterium rhizomatis TaxID=1631477 RepID=A0A5J5IY67_9MICO|nr:ferredoxin [Microbacterium rhizomatis]KAA9105926.1 ferredoxin [Microbacterium rhizomatis]
MKIQIDESRCIAAGNCVMTGADIYDQRDEDGIVVVMDYAPEDPELQRQARAGAAICPAKVITITED